MNLPKLKRKLKKQMLRLPHVVARRKKYITKVRNEYDSSKPAPSILCSTCIGGMISHNLGLKFMSPTVNLWMTSKDFVKFAANLEKYLAADFEPYENSYCDYPVGKLDDIIVYFQHYNTYEEACAKWNERKARIDFDNLYIITDDKGLDDSDIMLLDSIRCKRYIVFTNRETDNKNFFCYDCYKNSTEVGLYSVRHLSGFAAFEKEFNYSAWLSGKEDIRNH